MLSLVVRVYRKTNRPDALGVMVGVRLQPDALATLDAWRADQADGPTRPEAVRRLIDAALVDRAASFR